MLKPSKFNYFSNQIKNIMSETPAKSRIVYIILGLFLGCLGIHNFYAGYTGKGIAQLLITLLTFGIGAIVVSIWVLIEICTVAKDASGKAFC